MSSVQFWLGFKGTPFAKFPLPTINQNPENPYLFVAMFSPDIFDTSPSLFESELTGRMRIDDDYATKSGTEMDAPSGDDQDPSQRPKRKRYHRHTQHQIQEMEALGMNAMLKAENEKLRAENNRYKEALSNATCPNCGEPAAFGDMSFDEQHLRIENARLKKRITGSAAKYVGKTISIFFPHLPGGAFNFGTQSGFVGEMYGGGVGDLPSSDSWPTEADKPMIVELAVAAMEELMRMAQSGEPLWVPGENSVDALNEEEYLRSFTRGIGPKPLGLRSEASRDSAVIIMNHVNLVEILMDVNQWSSLFCGIVSRAMTLEVLSTGAAGNYNGALQMY
ncbi:Homeobox-leucine zipper protein MERISTEM L1 [Hibiscus syriacus]|uniref:Homeobox-leucine zipper protein MERISTEM L1 n=1 Tax=Hibiscus syriacus TaxID=106335 RepID=A0A6A2YD35_HIBSY|nr:Homeobox-leucine zipper protein MERISTEM L1 [Hibiscus syriacus]